MKPIAPQTGDPRPGPANVAAVLVTYHPGAGLYDRVQMLLGQVNSILIVDNGSTEAELAPVRRLETEGIAQVVLNGENLGQAMALNQGLAWASDLGVPWVVTFDQDTKSSTTLVEDAARVFDAHQARPLCAIAAGWILRDDQPRECEDPRGIEVPTVITSGSLHSVSVWRAVGRFRDDFFIDYVDTEYCLRARSLGYVITRGCLPTMEHAIGSPTRHRLIFRLVQPSNHNRVRRYFITRNRIIMWRAYWRTEPRYVLFDMKASAKELIKLVLFEDDRRGKIHAILEGVRDAAGGTTGPLPSRLSR